MGCVKKGEKYEGYYYLKYFIGGILTKLCLYMSLNHHMKVSRNAFINDATRAWNRAPKEIKDFFSTCGPNWTQVCSHK